MLCVEKCEKSLSNDTMTSFARSRQHYLDHGEKRLCGTTIEDDQLFGTWVA
jgi:hypothetical protein